MTIAYFDCFSGISGDMTLGALVGLGVPVRWLEGELKRLPVDEFSIGVLDISSHGIQANRMNIQVVDKGHHRDYGTISGMISGSTLPEKVKDKSLAMFRCIAEAEAAVHNQPVEKVHFHEVGGMDAIIDIVGACLALEYLKIERVAASPLPLGSGFVKCQHGTLPVPAPATVEILKGVPVYAGSVAKEMVTPTGAAIISSLTEDFVPMPLMRIDRVGYGAGSRELDDRPNVLRVIVGESLNGEADPALEKLVMVECNIDDMNPEMFGYLMDQLFEDGALDVFWEPVYMKKNRPGTLVRVLCRTEKRAGICERILSETTTLGVRFHEVQRSCLSRRIVEVDTPWGKIQAKEVVGIDGGKRVVPEFEACRKVAQTHGVALRTVYDAVLVSGAK